MPRLVLRKFPKHESIPVRVVADGAVGAEGVAGGRLIPVLILDTQNRPDIEENVRLHEGRGLGDVKSTWISIPAVSDACLLLEFYGHTSLNAIIAFEVGAQYLVVDHILRAKSVYLIPGRSGDRVKDKFGQVPAITVEVSAEWPEHVWERILTRAFVKEFKARGLNGKSAKELAAMRIRAWRKMSDQRIK